jgi:hypothetical protein
MRDFEQDYNSYKGNAYGLANTLGQVCYPSTAFVAPSPTDTAPLLAVCCIQAPCQVSASGQPVLRWTAHGSAPDPRRPALPLCEKPKPSLSVSARVPAQEGPLQRPAISPPFGSGDILRLDVSGTRAGCSARPDLRTHCGRPHQRAPRAWEGPHSRVIPRLSDPFKACGALRAPLGVCPGPGRACAACRLLRLRLA